MCGVEGQRRLKLLAFMRPDSASAVKVKVLAEHVHVYVL